MGDKDEQATVFGGDAAYWHNAFKTLQKIHAEDLARAYGKAPANGGTAERGTMDEAIRHAYAALPPSIARLVEREIKAIDRGLDIMPADDGFLADVMSLPVVVAQ